MSIESGQTINFSQDSEGNGPKERVVPFGMQFFSGKHGQIDVVSGEESQISDRDLQMGFRSSNQKETFLLDSWLSGFSSQLRDPAIITDKNRLDAVKKIRQGQPCFLTLPIDKINPTFRKATEKFPGTQPGIIATLHLSDQDWKSHLSYMSAARTDDGRLLRIMGGYNPENIEDFVGRLNNLTPPIQGEVLDENHAVYAVEFVENGHEPESITQEELEDWLTRLRASELIFGLDVSDQEGQRGLDNFIQKDGSHALQWIDGNITSARIAKDENEIENQINEHRKILGAYVRQ